MTTLRAAAQQALEALEHIEHHYISLPKAGNKAITALRAALAQEEQEPVACPHRDEPRGCYRVRCQLGRKCVEPLYTTPPRREWQSLSEEEIEVIEWHGSPFQFARAVEAKLKEKNHE
jgi:hypothetical protein